MAGHIIGICSPKVIIIIKLIEGFIGIKPFAPVTQDDGSFLGSLPVFHPAFRIEKIPPFVDFLGSVVPVVADLHTAGFPMLGGNNDNTVTGLCTING